MSTARSGRPAARPLLAAARGGGGSHEAPRTPGRPRAGSPRSWLMAAAPVAPSVLVLHVSDAQVAMRARRFGTAVPEDRPAPARPGAGGSRREGAAGRSRDRCRPGRSGRGSSRGDETVLRRVTHGPGPRGSLEHGGSSIAHGRVPPSGVRSGHRLAGQGIRRDGGGCRAPAADAACYHFTPHDGTPGVPSLRRLLGFSRGWIVLGRLGWWGFRTSSSSCGRRRAGSKLAFYLPCGLLAGRLLA